MSKEKLKINIFGKDYSLLVENEEMAKELVSYVDSIMSEMKKEMPEQTNETIAVLAALNIASDLFLEKNTYREYSIQATEKIKKLRLLISEKDISTDPSN